MTKSRREVTIDSRLSEIHKLQVDLEIEYADLCVERQDYYDRKWLSSTYERRQVPENISHYIMQGFGDLADPNYNGGFKKGLHEPKQFKCLHDALWWLDLWNVKEKFDPEDDRIVIWEVTNTGHKKPVWQASGWHWPYDEVDGIKLDQGCLLDDDTSLYSRVMEDY
jgi:hypothetical protein